MLTRAMMTAASGIINHQRMLDVTGNNISNVNTTGFRASRCSFEDQFYHTAREGTSSNGGTTAGVNPLQYGNAMRVAAISRDNSTGNITLTGRNEDLAIEGRGYFVVSRDSADARKYYTRDGSFTVSRPYDGLPSTERFLVTADGYYVNGVLADASGVVPAGPFNEADMVPMRIPLSELYMSATDGVTVNGTLDLNGDIATIGTSLQTAALIDNALGGAAATGATLLSDLRYQTAPALPIFGIGEVVTLRARIGGGAIEDATYPVTNASTVDDLRSFMATALRISETANAALPNSGVGLAVDVLDSQNLGGGVTTATLLTDPAIVWGAGGALAAGDEIEFAGEIGNRQVYHRHIVQAGDTVQTLLDSLASVYDAETISFAGGIVNITGKSGPTSKLTNVSVTEGGRNLLAMTPDAGALNGGVSNGVTANGAIAVHGNMGTYSALSHVNLYVNERLALPFSNETASANGSGSSSSFNVYDANGTPHPVSYKIVKIGQDANETQYRWTAYSFDDTTNSVSEGIFRIDINSGAIANWDPTNTVMQNATLNIVTATGGAQAIPINYANLRAIASESATISAIQTGGYPVGEMTEYSVGTDGVVVGYYTNGYHRNLGRIVLAIPQNENGFVSAGGNIFYAGANAGEVDYNYSASVIRMGALEESNVELSREFVSLITAQRGYQANTRIITTNNQMLDDLLNRV